jgi:hypothetical protein
MPSSEFNCYTVSVSSDSVALEFDVVARSQEQALELVVPEVLEQYGGVVTDYRWHVTLVDEPKILAYGQDDGQEMGDIA